MAHAPGLGHKVQYVSLEDILVCTTLTTLTRSERVCSGTPERDKPSLILHAVKKRVASGISEYSIECFSMTMMMMTISYVCVVITMAPQGQFDKACSFSRST